MARKKHTGQWRSAWRRPDRPTPKTHKVIVYHPFLDRKSERMHLPPTSSACGGTRSDEWVALVHWLRCVFGKGNVARVTYYSEFERDDKIVVWLSQGTQIDHMLGSHRWSEFLLSPREHERDQESLIHRYSPKVDGEISTTRSASDNLYDLTIRDPGHFRITRPYPFPIPTSREEVKPEPVEDVKPTRIKLDEQDEGIFMPLHYLILFNPIGLKVNNPSDLSGVIAWLEHRDLFGPFAVQAFWARILDPRLIVSVSCPTNVLFRVLGTHVWKDCISNCPSDQEDDESEVLLLIERLRTSEALAHDGWQKLELHRTSSPLLQFVEPYPDSEKRARFAHMENLAVGLAETFHGVHVSASEGFGFVKEEIKEEKLDLFLS